MRTITQNDYKIIIINEDEQLDAFEYLDADILIINAVNEDIVTHFVEQIRSNKSESILLKPVFLLSYNTIKNTYLQTMVDGVISSESQIESIFPIVEGIINRASQLFINDNEYTIEESEVLTKLLRYMHTRNWHELVPIRNRNYKLGFVFPILSHNIAKYDEYKIPGLLKTAVLEGIFTEQFIEKIYLCNYCYDSFVQYREVCPKCISANLEEEELIHHFRCATIAPAKKFKKDNTSALYCPKCSKELRHIGIDYDKPATMYHCKACSNTFQDYLVKAKCTNCETDSAVEYLIGENINHYKLSKKGEHIAKKGIQIEYVPEVQWDLINMDSTNKFKEKYQEFSTLLAKKQMKQFEVGVIYIKGFDKIKRITGIEYFNKLSGEVFSLVAHSLDASKTHIYQNESSMFFITHNFSYNELNQKINSLIDLIEKLMNNNTNLSEKLDLEYVLINVNQQMPVDSVFEQLTNI